MNSQSAHSAETFVDIDNTVALLLEAMEQIPRKSISRKVRRLVSIGPGKIIRRTELTEDVITRYFTGLPTSPEELNKLVRAIGTAFAMPAPGMRIIPFPLLTVLVDTALDNKIELTSWSILLRKQQND